MMETYNLIDDLLLFAFDLEEKNKKKKFENTIIIIILLLLLFKQKYKKNQFINLCDQI